MDVKTWSETAHLYHIYPRSFKDTNGDGIGEIKGIRDKVAYLKEIGVTAMWMSPIFKSPMADMGYDISDYRTVDPLYGTNDDLKSLLETLKKIGIKLLLDLVPNHTSDQHEWFQKSVKKEDPYTDYYVWEDGTIDKATGKRVPPNNWVTNFTGSAWEWNEERQQFYLHQFLAQQPDLNYRNPKVVKEMDGVILFWLDFGVDGFRVDALPFLVEDKELRDNPVKDGVPSDEYTQSRPETYELVQHWARLVSTYSKKEGRDIALFMEAYADLDNTLAYYGTGDESLMQPFNFFLLKDINQNSRPKHFKEIIMSWIEKMPPGASVNWVIGNHDNPRAATRYGPQMVDAMNLLTGVLPGCKVTYYGEEIGMEDTYVRFDQTQDTSVIILGPDKYLTATRDPERTPMQWNDSVSAGFSTNSHTWLPVNPNYWTLNVANQERAEASHLKVFKAMAAARQDPVLLHGDLQVLVPTDDTLVVVRSFEGKRFVLIINMGSDLATYTSGNFFQPNHLDDDMTVAVSSVNSGLPDGLGLNKGAASITLRPKGAVLLHN